MNKLRDVLELIESRLGRIEAAIHHNHQEVLEAVSNVQNTIDIDVAELTQCLADFASEWQAISSQVAAQSRVDTSKLDALASQAQAMDAAWKAQLAPAAGSTTEPTGTTSGTGSSSSPDASSGTADAGSSSTGTGTDTGSATTTDAGTATADPGSGAPGDTTAGSTDATTGTGSTPAE